jgi:hypothetical protein
MTNYAPEMFHPSDLVLDYIGDVLTWRLDCPLCGCGHYLCEQEFHGRLQVVCHFPACPFRARRDFSELLDRVDWGRE